MNNTTDKNKSNSFQGNANTPLLSSQSLPPTPSTSPPLEKKRLTLKLNINRENLSARLPVFNPFFKDTSEDQKQFIQKHKTKAQTNRLSEAKDQNLVKEKASNNLSNIKSKDNASTKEYAANNFKDKVSIEENTAVTSSDKTSKEKSIKDKEKKPKKDKKPKPPPKPQIVHPKAKMKPDEYLSTLKTLQKKFPKAFNRKVQLLKIDIHKDILESSDLNITRIRSFLNLYCNTKRYKRNYVFGKERFDLNGEVAGTYDIVKEAKKEKTKEISEVKDGQELNSSPISLKAEGIKKSDNTKEVGESKSQENKNIHQTLQNNKPQPKPQHNKLKQASVQSKSQQSFNQNKSQVPYHQQNKNAQGSHQQIKSQTPSQPSQQNKLQQPKSQQNYQPSSQHNKSRQPAQQKKPESLAQQKKLDKYALFEKEMLGKF